MSARSETEWGYPGWPVAIAAGVGVFFASLVIVTFPVLLRPLAQEFSWSRQAVSTAFGIAAGVAALCAAPLGYALDHVGVRRVAIPALALLGCAYASLALLTPSLAHLYVTFAVLGFAGISTSPVAYGRAISTWFRARRGMALAFVITGGAIGGMVHPLIFTVLSRSIGWRGAVVALGAATLVIGLPVVWRLVRERPATADAPVAAAGATFAEGLRSPLFWLLGVAILCGTMAQNSVLVHLSALLTDRGIGAEQAALALSAMAAAAIAGRLVTGWIVDRVFAVGVLIAMLALASAGAFLLSGAQSLGAGVVAAVLEGFGTGGEADVVPYLLSRYFGLRSFSALYGMAWTTGAIGGAAGPVLMGRAFDTTGSYESMLVRLAVVVLGAAVLMMLLPRYEIAPAPLAAPATAASDS